MSKYLFKNNASGTLAAEITAIATSIPLGVGAGAAFPNPGTGEAFIATLQVGADIEIVEVTSRSGDTLTVTRAQEGTTARIWPVGTPIEMRLTAGLMATFFQLLANTVDFAKTLALGTTGKITGGTLDGNTLVNSTINSPNLKVAAIKPADGNTAKQIVLPNGGADPTIAGKKILTQAGDTGITGDLETTGAMVAATGTFGNITWKTGTTVLGSHTISGTAVVFDYEEDIDIVFSTDGVERIHYEASNRWLGIGTSTPGAAVHYYKNAAELMAYRLQNSVATLDVQLGLDGKTAVVWGGFEFKMTQGGNDRIIMDTTGRITSNNATGFNGNATGVRYVGTSDPSGGSDGDIWLKV